MKKNDFYRIMYYGTLTISRELIEYFSSNEETPQKGTTERATEKREIETVARRSGECRRSCPCRNKVRLRKMLDALREGDDARTPYRTKKHSTRLVS